MKWLIPLFVILSGYAYVCHHLWTLLPLSVRAAGVTLSILLLLCMVAAFAWSEQLPVWISKILYETGTAWVFIFLYLLLVFLLLDLAGLAFPSVKPYFMHQWSGTIAIGVALVFIFGYGRWHYEQKKRVTLDLKTTKHLEQPLKIVMVSDLHLGYTIGKSETENWAGKINAEHPDIILIAGDIVDFSLRPLEKCDMFSALHRLKAPLGVYACSGNHDVMARADRQADFHAKTGIRFLNDETVLADNRIYIVGRRDRSYSHRKPLGDLLKGLDRTKPVILLDHQPYHLEEAEKNGIDLQLSGHTHRGQVFPVNLITDALYEISHGYLKKGATHIYVSSGLGIWGGKFRIGSQSEYTVINFHQ